MKNFVTKTSHEKSTWKAKAQQRNW